MAAAAAAPVVQLQTAAAMPPSRVVVEHPPPPAPPPHSLAAAGASIDDDVSHTDLGLSTFRKFQRGGNLPEILKYLDWNSLRDGEWMHVFEICRQSLLSIAIIYTSKSIKHSGRHSNKRNRIHTYVHNLTTINHYYSNENSCLKKDHHHHHHQWWYIYLQLLYAIVINDNDKINMNERLVF